MSRRRYLPAKEGEWLQPRMRGYLTSCCGCGLVHRMNFQIVYREEYRKARGGKWKMWRRTPVVQYQAFLEPRKTAAKRRKLKARGLRIPKGDP